MTELPITKTCLECRSVDNTDVVVRSPKSKAKDVGHFSASQSICSSESAAWDIDIDIADILESVAWENIGKCRNRQRWYRPSSTTKQPVVRSKYHHFSDKVEMEYRLFYRLIWVYIDIRRYFWRVCKISFIAFVKSNMAANTHRSH